MGTDINTLAPCSDEEAEALSAAYMQGLRGQRPNWIHNLGDAFEARLRQAYASGKRDKIARALQAMRTKK